MGDDYTTTTGPDGKVTVTDHATGVSIALEKLTYAEALRLDKKLADDIGTAETNRNTAQKKLTDAGLTPEMLANPDPSKFTAEQAKLYKEYLQAQAGLNKLLVERRILVAQFKVSLAEPGTKEHTQAINELLDEVYLQQRVTENDNAKIDLADKAINLIAANGNASKYALFDDALAAFRAIPDNDYYFDPDGFVNGHHEDTGKLLKQEVIFKDGQIYLRNTYENHIWDGSNVLDIPLTFDPDKKRYRTDAQRQIDLQWDGQSGAFTRGLCVSVDTGWSAARTHSRRRRRRRTKAPRATWRAPKRSTSTPPSRICRRSTTISPSRSTAGRPRTSRRANPTAAASGCRSRRMANCSGPIPKSRRPT